MSIAVETGAPQAGTGAADRLRAKIGLAMPAFYGRTVRLWSSADLNRRYESYLVVMHQMVRATVPLMRLGIELCDALDDDPVATAFGVYLRKHIREETGHDEWVRQDLMAINPRGDLLLAQMPPAAVANVVGAQYYWMSHHHPVVLLGHIAVLEGYPPKAALADHLAERSGLPTAAFRTLQRHAVIDRRHSREVFETADALRLTRAQEAELGVSALHTLSELMRVFDSLLASQHGRLADSEMGG